jgi:hypothetical protein
MVCVLGEEIEKKLKVVGDMIMSQKKVDVEEDNMVMDTKLKIIEILKVSSRSQNQIFQRHDTFSQTVQVRGHDTFSQSVNVSTRSMQGHNTFSQGQCKVTTHFLKVSTR